MLKQSVNQNITEKSHSFDKGLLEELEKNINYNLVRISYEMLKQLITLQLNLIHELEVCWKSF